MEKKYFSFLIVVFFLFLGCAHIERASETRDIVLDDIPMDSLKEESIEVVISSFSVSNFTEKDKILLRCLIIEALQQKELQPLVSEKEASACNKIVKSSVNLAIKDLRRQMKLSPYNCSPFFVESPTLQLKIEVLEIKRGSKALNIIFSRLVAPRPEIRAIVSLISFKNKNLLMKKEVIAKAPVSSLGFGAVAKGMSLNFFEQVLWELAQNIF